MYKIIQICVSLLLNIKKLITSFFLKNNALYFAGTIFIFIFNDYTIKRLRKTSYILCIYSFYI